MRLHIGRMTNDGRLVERKINSLKTGKKSISLR